MPPYRASVVGPTAFFSVLRFVAVVLLAVMVLFSLGCGGGSSSTTTTTTGVAPTFSSTAPTVVSEGILYTYNITTTTTDGSTVTYKLTTGPTGATISGSTLSWTPTHAESRTSNSFEITATTSNNGTANQSFTLTPTGNINGTVVDHAVTTGGIVDVNENLAGQSIAILFPNGTGGYNTLKGSGDSSGNIVVPNVGAGSFFLHIPRIVDGVTTDTYIWTNASDIDAGGLILGRPNAVPGTGVSVHASGIAATAGASDTVQWNSPDARAYGNPGVGVTNPYSASFAQTGNLIDSTQGDRAYLLHYKDLGKNVSAILEDVPYTNITESNNTTVNVGGSMAAVSGSTTDPVIKLTQFDPLYSGLTNNSTVSKIFAAYDTAYKGDEGLLPAVNLITADLSTLTADTDLGSINYGIVTPSGSAYYEFSDNGTRAYTVNSTNFQFSAGASVISNTMPTSSTAIVPLIGVPLSPLVNGGDFFTNQTTTTTTPQISWRGPSLGTATSYLLQIVDVSDSFTTTPQTINFYTTANSVTVPSGVLVAGKTYVFVLTAANDASTQSAPYRVAAQSSYAYEASGLITVGSSTAPKPSTATPARTVRVALGPDHMLCFTKQ